MKFELARTHYLMGCHFQGIRAPDGPPRHDAKDDDSPQAERDGDPKIMTVSRETDAEGDRPTGPPPPPRPFHRRSERDRPDHQGSHGPRHREEREHWWRDLVRREQENREHLEQAATLFAELTNAHPSVSHYQYWLALCYLELAKHFSQPAESEEAPERDEGRKRAVEILEALVDEHPQKADYLYQLSEAYELSYRQIIGIGRWPKGNWEDESRDVTPEQLEQVEHDLRSALRVSDRLIVQQPHIPGYAFSNFALMMRLMEVLEEREDYRGALAIWERLKASRETFADLFPKFRHFGGEADPGPDPVREFFRANILMKEGKFPEARTLLESITGRFEDRPHRSGRRWHWHRWMADVYELLESCLIELGDTEEAAKIREKREALHRDDDRGD